MIKMLERVNNWNVALLWLWQHYYDESARESSAGQTCLLQWQQIVSKEGQISFAGKIASLLYEVPKG